MMKIAVCIKQVPTREWQPRLAEDKKWIQEQDVSYEMNEPDAYALEEALRLREKHGGEVVVCSAGPSRVAKVLREALARGADRGLHIEADRLGSADAFVVADALAAAMKEESFDLRTADYGGHDVARYVAHMYYWLCGKGDEFRTLGGQAWPWQNENQIGPSYGFDSKNGYLPDWRKNNIDGYAYGP